MVKYLIPENGNFYKANLHCHSVLSDGKLTVGELKEKYMEKGYSVIAFSDHDKYHDHQDLTDENFLAINSYEISIASTDRSVGRYVKCYHLNLFDKYPSKDRASITEFPTYENIDEVNAFIKSAADDGFLISYNHPEWSLQTFEDYSKLKGCFGVEIYNTGCFVDDGLDGMRMHVYDDMIRLGNKMYCIASDDNHNKYPFDNAKSDSFGGFVMIKAPELKYNSIMTALETGDFYASNGPLFKKIYVENNRIYIECSEVKKISLITPIRHGRSEHTLPGEFLTSADFELDVECEKYLRVEIIDEFGNKASSRAFFRNELF